ncbi:MAG: hypothetical protein GX126_05130 [Bacteroidales bacterium]|nr:hypothetical protein [Bacteroidales bacterium]
MKKNILKTRQLIQKISLFLIVSLLTGFLGCKKDNDDLTLNQLDKIEFKVVTMEGDIEREIFDEGTDVAFAIKIVNNSDKDFEWYHDYSCIILNQEDFLFAKKKIVQASEYSDISYTPLGKPYPFPVNCPTINLPPQLITPGEERILIKLRWSDNPDNEELSAGEYFTEFTLNLTVKEYQKSWNLRTDFIIH